MAEIDQLLAALKEQAAIVASAPIPDSPLVSKLIERANAVQSWRTCFTALRMYKHGDDDPDYPMSKEEWSWMHEHFLSCKDCKALPMVQFHFEWNEKHPRYS